MPTYSSQPSTSRRLSPVCTSVVAVTSESSTPALVRSHRYGCRAASFPAGSRVALFCCSKIVDGALSNAVGA